jgi:hypothetical protein
MDPNTLSLLVDKVVNDAVQALSGSLANGDASQTFKADLQLNFGAFLALLTRIEAAINAHPSLHPAPSFRIGTIPNNPATRRPFAEEFFAKSIDELSTKVSEVRPPYNL